MLGGLFDTLSGQHRDMLGRLTSGGAALQKLTINVNGTTTTWNRDGTGPEIEQVTFELSTDNANYTPLGNATRIDGGWQLTGLLLPVGKNFYLRARGRTVGGQYNGSSGMLQTVAQFYRIPPAHITSVGKTGGGVFQFAFTNTSGASFTVIATTNVAAPVASWEVLGPPQPIGNGIFQFTDPSVTDHQRRFYQLRSP